jgi:Trk K+ transport system NAD-binding subunit
VSLIDTDPQSDLPELQPNLKLFISSTLDTDVLEEAGLLSVGTFLAMISNGEVNLVAAQRAAEESNPPRVLAVVPKSSNRKIQQAFDAQILLKTWNQHLIDRAVKLGETILKKALSLSRRFSIDFEE